MSDNVFFCSDAEAHWQSGPDYLWWCASIPVQTLSITHAHMHTNTCGVWKQDTFYVQGTSIIHGIFNVNRLLLFATVSLK